MAFFGGDTVIINTGFYRGKKGVIKRWISDKAYEVKISMLSGKIELVAFEHEMTMLCNIVIDSPVSKKEGVCVHEKTHALGLIDDINKLLAEQNLLLFTEDEYYPMLFKLKRLSCICGYCTDCTIGIGR